MVFSDRFNLNYDLPDEWPNLGIFKIMLHATQILVGFLVLFLVTPVISAERQYDGSSQASPNYVLTIALFSMSIASLLALCPWPHEKCSRLWRFFLRPRTSLVFTGFFSSAWLIGMISATTHAAHCTLSDTLRKQDNRYSTLWIHQCACAKAVAVFSWIDFFLWLATAMMSVILFWQEKKLKYERSPMRDDIEKDRDLLKTPVLGSIRSLAAHQHPLPDLPSLSESPIPNSPPPIAHAFRHHPSERMIPLPSSPPLSYSPPNSMLYPPRTPHIYPSPIVNPLSVQSLPYSPFIPKK
ncbi:hypothetical protein G6F57_009017 [Rhizopus arrhizus]|nr:hypothetical protein G6F23_004194 [Rhizopus arrhizus]KAG1417121.1 hypothetical protein G6F58_005650 [Rhizopus delemar]KAG0759621.1 hypothetical protein G6F24_008929 [Rhizopus arrhizus]KAG0791363.1 hypothetical protein G6F21_005134 [Rhizopus arrhizus]KAG0808458.1 hypothetical protein G6F20_009559 [Rhizopus arrhizus]